MTLPIIDLGPSGEGDGASLSRIAAEIGAACREMGFFYVVNHGVAPELIAKTFAQSHAFFALPVGDKRELAIETIGGNRGYSGLLHEALDPARGPDMKEAFDVGLDLAADDAELLATTMTLAQRIAAMPHVALGYTKRNLAAAETGDFAMSLDMEAFNQARCSQMEDHREAVLAFKEKRKPVFSGR